MPPQLIRRLLSFAHAPAADEQDHRRSALGQLVSSTKIRRDALRHLPPVAIDEHANRLAGGLGSLPRELPGPLGEHVFDGRVCTEIIDGERLRGVEPLPDGLVLPVFVVEGEWSGLQRRIRTQRRRQRQQAEGRWKAGAGAGASKPPGGHRPRVVLHARPALLLDGLQKSRERPRQVRLVQQHEGVAAHQSRLIGAHAPRDTVPLEQQARADHVDGADDDRRRRGIFHPFAVVHVLAAKRGDGQFPAREPQVAAHRFECRFLQTLTDLLSEIGGLIDHRSPVDDVDEPAGQRGSGSTRQQPDGHDRGLAEPGRDVHGRRQVSGAQLVEQPALPRKRVVDGQRLERRIEMERVHADPHMSEVDGSAPYVLTVTESVSRRGRA